MTQFVVGDVFEIKDRGPCITRPVEQSGRAVDAGEFFTQGETIHCGTLEATIVGIEHYRGGSARTQAMQLALLLGGVAFADLERGQVWVPA